VTLPATLKRQQPTEELVAGEKLSFRPH